MWQGCQFNLKGGAQSYEVLAERARKMPRRSKGVDPERECQNKNEAVLVAAANVVVMIKNRNHCRRRQGRRVPSYPSPKQPLGRGCRFCERSQPDTQAFQSRSSCRSLLITTMCRLPSLPQGSSDLSKVLAWKPNPELKQTLHPRSRGKLHEVY